MVSQATRICGYALALMVLSVLCTGCADDENNLAVAQVADRTITARDVRDFIEKLPEHGTGKGVDAGQEKDHLQTMIAMELLLIQARHEGIETNPAFLSKMKRARTAKLVRVFEQRAIDAIAIDEKGIEDYIERMSLNRAIRLGDIKVADQETAQAVLREIRQGADFAEVARMRSTDRVTSVRGGDIGRYAMREQMIPLLAESLFSLAVGSVSDPIRIGGGYSIFKILNGTTVELDPRQRMSAAKGLEREKFQAARDSIVAELREKYRLELDREGLAVVVEALQHGTSAASEDPSTVVLYRYDGGEITAADLLDVVRSRKGNVLATLKDGEQVLSFAVEYVVPDIMILEAAVRGGIDHEEEISAWLKNQGKQLMTRGLRAKVLQERVKITEDEVRQYYEAHADNYLHPEKTEVQEILVETRPLAIDLKQRIEEEGALFRDLARVHSIRSLEVRDEEGKFHVHRHESAQFGGFVEVAAEAEIGELTGPVKVREGYSIFRVLSRDRRRESFSEANLRVRSQLKRERRREAFNAFVEELRKRYESEVTIYGDRLKAAFAAG